MAKIYCINVERIYAGDVDFDQEKAWLEFHIEDKTRVRLIFKESLILKIRLALQKLLGRFTEIRLQKGLPSLQVSHQTKVKRIEFGHNEEKKVALVRTWYESGEYQDMVLPEQMMRETITYLQGTLYRFSQSKTWKN